VICRRFRVIGMILKFTMQSDAHLGGKQATCESQSR